MCYNIEKLRNNKHITKENKNMNTLNIFNKLKEAFECSTKNNNLFEKALQSINWENKFFADGEFYFIKGDLTFTTPSVDPFNMCWEPSGIFKDGSVLMF